MVFFVVKIQKQKPSSNLHTHMKNKALLLLLSAALMAGCRFTTSKDNDDDDKDSATGTVVHSSGRGVFNLGNKAGVKTARLNLEAGAIVVNLADTTDKLFNAVVTDTTRKFELSQETTDAGEVVNFRMREHKHNFHDDSASVSLRLNTSPQWEIKAKVAAAQCTFDLSKFKISKLGLSCAAGDVHIKLAPVLPDTYVDINASVGAIIIRIPQDAACEVHVESALADEDFPGFQKEDSNHYQTAGFATSKNKIHIDANCSLSSFKIERY